jgi:ABC-type iron transport system FetAB permease component
MNRKQLKYIGLVAGVIAILMLFVIPFLLDDNFSMSPWLYFVVFLCMTALGNITMEKSMKPLNKQEERKYKLKRILK